MSTSQLLAQITAATINEVIKQQTNEIVKEVQDKVDLSPKFTKSVTEKEVVAAAAQVLTQDKLLESKRIWTIIIPIISTIGYALLSPDTIEAFVGWLKIHPGALWGVAANVAALLLPVLSKVLDPRVVSQK